MLLLAYDVTSYPLNNNNWSFPLCEIIHILGFAFSIGTVAIVDFTMLGIGVKNTTPMQVLKDTNLWTIAGIVSMWITGPLIFFSDPYMYVRNASFRFKIGAFVLATLYNFTIHRMVAKSGNATGIGGKLVAIVSLGLWISVVFGGLFIAFV